MKKIAIHGPGDYSKLKLETAPDMLATHPDEVVVEVKATGINYADVIIRWGLHKSLRSLLAGPSLRGGVNSPEPFRRSIRRSWE